MDIFDSQKRSRVMKQVRSKNTGPEVIVRRKLHSLGYRYRIHLKDLPGKPDIAFPGRKKALFINGCFWHQHAGCKAADRPATNCEYWNKKLNANIERDSQNYQKLNDIGWKYLVVWECEIKNIELCVERIIEFLD